MYDFLGMLIPGYVDTRVPCGLPGSRETSDLPSYHDRLHQSTDCQCGHIQASTALAAAENAERPVLVDNYCTRPNQNITISQQYHISG